MITTNSTESIVFIANTESDEESKVLESVATNLIKAFGKEFFSDFNLDVIVEELSMDLRVQR